MATLLILVFGVGIASLSSLVGFVYPAYKSFQAIETKTKGDDTQWLVYWVIFAIFSIMEVFVDLVLYWIPFYYAVRFVLYLDNVFSTRWIMIVCSRRALSFSCLLLV